jgi:hypothetical protein
MEFAIKVVWMFLSVVAVRLWLCYAPTLERRAINCTSPLERPIVRSHRGYRRPAIGSDSHQLVALLQVSLLR